MKSVLNHVDVARSPAPDAAATSLPCHIRQSRNMRSQVAEKFARWWHREEEEEPPACEEADDTPSQRRQLQRREEPRQDEAALLNVEAALEGTPAVPFGEHHLYLLSSDPSQVSPNDRESYAWFSAWRRHFDCWYLGLPAPTQMQLGGCMGALALHLGSRLDAVARLALRSGNREPGGVLRASSAGDGACTWLEQPSREFVLPEFPPLPEMPGANFLLPPVHRLLPSWEHLRQVRARSRDTLNIVGTRDQGVGSSGATPILAGAGAGFAAGAVLVLGAIRWRRRCSSGCGAEPSRLQARRSLHGKTASRGMSAQMRRSMAMSC